jgi:hypothetical protein
MKRWGDRFVQSVFYLDGSGRNSRIIVNSGEKDVAILPDGTEMFWRGTDYPAEVIEKFPYLLKDVVNPTEEQKGAAMIGILAGY